MKEYKHILKALAEGDYRLTLHARKRMAERNATHADIRCCGKSGKVSMQGDDKIKVIGVDIDGYDLTLICVEENDVLIITVF